MASVHVTGNQATCSSSAKSALSIVGSATVVCDMYEFTLSTSGAPVDGVLTWRIIRETAEGTGTSVTPKVSKYSPGIVTPIAVGATAFQNHTVESASKTAASEEFEQGINVRAAYRWYVGPGDEMQIPAIAAAGFVFDALSSVTTTYTGPYDVTARWRESN